MKPKEIMKNEAIIKIIEIVLKIILALSSIAAIYVIAELIIQTGRVN